MNHEVMKPQWTDVAMGYIHSFFDPVSSLFETGQPALSEEAWPGGVNVFLLHAH